MNCWEWTLDSYRERSADIETGREREKWETEREKWEKVRERERERDVILILHLNGKWMCISYMHKRTKIEH